MKPYHVRAKSLGVDWQPANLATHRVRNIRHRLFRQRISLGPPPVPPSATAPFLPGIGSLPCAVPLFYFR